MSILKRVLYRPIILILFLGNTILLSSQAPATREYQIKAVFLFNFTQFIEWPPNVFTEANAPIIIGVLGADPFGPYLDETVANEIVKGHPLVIQRYSKIDEIGKCHILFIHQSKQNIEEIIPKLKGKSILTVSDAPDFIQKGGMIKFVNQNNKIQLQINPKAAEAAGLSISSKLLRLADIIVQ